MSLEQAKQVRKGLGGWLWGGAGVHSNGAPKGVDCAKKKNCPFQGFAGICMG